MVDTHEAEIPASVSTRAGFPQSVALGAVFILTLAIAGLIFYSASRKENNTQTVEEKQVRNTVSVSQDEFDKELGRRVKADEELRRKNAKAELLETKKQVAASIKKQPKRVAAQLAKAVKDPFKELEKKQQLEELERVFKARTAGIGFDVASASQLSNSATYSGGLFSGDSGSDLGSVAENIPSFPKGYEGSNATRYVEAPEGTLVVPAGTVISAVLQQEIISDYPGRYIARIANDVFDREKDNVIIPIGSKILGESIVIRNPNQAISFRLAMPVKEIIRPDGLRIDLSKSTTNMMDTFGVGAIDGPTNFHFIPKLLGTVAYAGLVGFSTGLGLKIADSQFSLSGSSSSNEEVSTDNPTQTTETSLPNTNVAESDDTEDHDEDNEDSGGDTTVSTQLTIAVSSDSSDQDSRDNSDEEVAEVIAETISKGLTSALGPFLEGYISLIPTATILPGTQLKIMLVEDVYANPWENVYSQYTGQK